MELSNGEKLILLMLSDIYDHLKIEGGINPQFVQKAIFMEEIWSLGCKYPSIIGSGEYNLPPVVREAMEILEMCEMLEISYERLKPADKARIEAEVKLIEHNVRFRGFDGNNEADYMAVADLLVNDLERFHTFKGRDLNSHSPLLDVYRRMLKIFRLLRNSQYYDILNVEQIITLLKEQTSPENR